MLRDDSCIAPWALLASTGFVGYVLHRRRPWFYAFCAGIAFTWATKETVFITGFIFATYMAVSFIWEHVGRTERRMLAGLCAGGLVTAFFTAVVGVLGEGTVREVGGALVGGLVGAGLGYLYDTLRKSDEQPAPSTRAVPARAARTGRRRGPTGRFNRELDRPQGPF